MPKLDLIASEKLSPALKDTIESAPLPGLEDAPKCPDTRAAIERLLNERSAEFSPPSPSAAAGLWLLAGELDLSHDISQTLESPTGSYWHGIMHRRERDFNNAKYWMRRAAGHPVIEELANHIDNVAGQDALAWFNSNSGHKVVGHGLTDSDSLATNLVDLCQQMVGSQPKVVSELQLIFWWEWQLLFRYGM